SRGQGPDPDDQFIMHIAKDNASGGQRHPAPLFRGIRNRRYTYFITGDGAEHLFDNDADPYQLNDLGAGPNHTEIRGRFRDRLRAHLTRARDTFEPLSTT
ncbi:MAG TPA: hypothetical protein PLX03_11330, partial [Candidatus Hydrogenedentes bacterium]|nr:hypothetical protein [Candidatus Hydrogenedentota bacterium]